MAELNVKKCIQHLKVIKNCISASEENKDRFKEVKRSINDILIQLSTPRSLDDQIREQCDTLKGEVQEFSGEADVLKVKQSVRDFTTIIKKLSLDELQGFHEELKNNDTDGILNYYSSLSPDESYDAAWDFYEKKRYKEAFILANDAWVGGKKRVCYLLGLMYEYGNGVEKNATKAFEYYMVSALVEVPVCQYKVSYFYENGYGVTKDAAKAHEWLVKSADNGDDDAIVDLGCHYIHVDNLDKAFSLFSKALEMGNRRAKMLSGLCYEEGWGTPRNLDKAKALFKEEMEAGNEKGKEAYERVLETERGERSNSPSIRITSIKFADTDKDNNIIRTYGQTLYSDVSYLKPQITYEVLSTGEPVEIWYKIYAPDGTLSYGDSSKSGFTWKGTINRTSRTTFTTSLGGWGNTAKDCYKEGIYRIEFYEGDTCLYKASVTINRHIASRSKPVSTPTSKSTSSTSKYSTKSVAKKKKSPLRRGIMIGILMAIVYAIYTWWYVPYATDRDTPRMYVYATNLFMRSTKDANVDYNRMGTIPYGAELITYSQSDGWANVKWKLGGDDTGYVSSDYLINYNDFCLLDGIWGNEDSKEAVPEAKCRLAMLEYLKKNGIKSGTSEWQLFTQPADVKTNSVFYPKLDNGYDNSTSYAFILTNNTTKERRVVIYSFIGGETPVLVYEEQAPEEGEIKNITYAKWSKRYKVTYSGKYRSGKPIEKQQSSSTDSPPNAKVVANTSPVSTPSAINEEVADKKEVQTETANINDNSTYDKAEQMPEFPGGPASLVRYLNKSVKYPVAAQESGIQGRVVVSFIVDKDGSITNIEASQSLNPHLDKEAINVIKSMPKWTPAKNNGVPVRCKYSLPIMFRLK